MVGGWGGGGQTYHRINRDIKLKCINIGLEFGSSFGHFFHTLLSRCSNSIIPHSPV